MNDSRFGRDRVTRNAYAWLMAMGLCLGGQFALADLLPDDIVVKTDEELTALTARWNELSSTERRLVLHEVRTRMHASKISAQRQINRQIRRTPAQGTGTVVQRRYGRKPDGSVVVQTRVIQKHGSVSGAPTSGRITFGFGFERRAQGQHQPGQPGARDGTGTNQAGTVVNQPQDGGVAQQSPALEP